MTTPAKNSCAFCPTPAHHTSVLHVLVHKMQLEALCGNRAFFLKCNYRGNRGRTWENSEELQRSAWICGDLLRAYSDAVGIVGVSSVSHEIKRHGMYRCPILGLYYFVAGVFLWLLTGIKWLQIGLLDGGGHKTYLPVTSNQFVAIETSREAMCGLRQKTPKNMQF